MGSGLTIPIHRRARACIWRPKTQPSHISPSVQHLHCITLCPHSFPLALQTAVWICLANCKRKVRAEAWGHDRRIQLRADTSRRATVAHQIACRSRRPPDRLFAQVDAHRIHVTHSSHSSRTLQNPFFFFAFRWETKSRACRSWAHGRSMSARLYFRCQPCSRYESIAYFYGHLTTEIWPQLMFTVHGTRKSNCNDTCKLRFSTRSCSVVPS
jgi:hypothetical protein